MRLASDPTCKHLIGSVFGLLFVVCISSDCSSAKQVQDSCANFERTIKATYDFRPALLSDSERAQKVIAMDKVWETVKSEPARLLPCLRNALEDPQANAWFRFDGSNLLVSLDPSPASKKLLIQDYAASNLDDVELSLWVSNLARLAAEGFDVSTAGERWLSYSNARYFLPEHGAYEVKRFQGALFIFGSMDEAQATPALMKIISNVVHPGREDALLILINQATPESVQALTHIDTSGFSTDARRRLKEVLEHPKLIEKRTKPKTSREEFLQAFQAMVNGNSRLFLDLVSEVPDGERDVVATLGPNDVPLVRRVRRLIISSSNPHSIEFYDTFTDILRTITRNEPKGANSN